MSSCCKYQDNLKCVDILCPFKKAPVFWSVNLVASILHLINAAAMTYLWSISDNKDTYYRLTETYAPWIPTVNGTCTLPNIKLSEEWCLGRKTETTQELSLWWLIIGFHGLSFFFQMLSFVECKTLKKYNYVEEVEEFGTNTLRMIEYSFSASLMQIAIALLLGVWQNLVIIAIAFLTAITMLLGLIAEQLRKTDLKMAWISHFIGWISMSGVWVILIKQFTFTIQKSPNKPPSFVYVIVGVIGALYTIFGFVQMYQLFKTNRMREDFLNKKVEMLYCVNSLVSKTFLGWMIFSNALVGVAQS